MENFFGGFLDKLDGSEDGQFSANVIISFDPIFYVLLVLFVVALFVKK